MLIAFNFYRTNILFFLVSLEDWHYFEFSLLFVRQKDVQELSYNVLKLESKDVDSSINRNDKNYQMAAHDILNEWQKGQPDGKIAYEKLHGSLIKHNWQKFATELKNIVEKKIKGKP